MKKLYYLIILLLVGNIGTAQEAHNHDFCRKAKIRNAKLKSAYKKSNVGKNIDINYHRLEMNIDPAINYISGKNTVYFKCKEALSAFTLDMFYTLNPDSVFFRKQKITTQHTGNILTLNLGTTLQAETLDSVEIYYQGVPSGSGSTGGFTIGSHGAFKPVAFTLSEPYGAREWWPCKQDLDDKIDSIDIMVTSPLGFKTASNGILVSTKEVDENVRYHWRHRHPIAAYLVAVAVTNFSEFSDYYKYSETDSVEILNYVYPENEWEIKPKLQITKDLMKVFSEQFILYPFADEKYGHAEFGWGGGMEHQTMSFMGSWHFSIVAHELAHQWFGDYITCGSWKDIWLNEGFATYLESLAYEAVYGKDSYFQDVISNFSRAKQEPHGTLYVDDTTSINRIFSSNLSYAKGGSVLHMLRYQVGDEDFFKSVNSYLHDPKVIDNYAKTADIERNFAQNCERDLTQFFNDWVYGGGFPSYHMQWKQNENFELEITLNQSQSDASVSFFEMLVPLRFYGSEKDTTIIIDHTQNEQVITVPLDFNVAYAEIDPDNYILKGYSSVNSLDSQTVKSEINIAPNPVNQICKVYLPHSFDFKTIEIYSLTGNKVKEFTGGNFNTFIYLNVKELESGNYILRLKAKDETISKLFFKK